MYGAMLDKARKWGYLCVHSDDDPYCWADCRDCVEDRAALSLMLKQLNVDKRKHPTKNVLLFVCEPRKRLIAIHDNGFVNTLDVACDPACNNCSAVLVCRARKMNDAWYIRDTDGDEYNIDNEVVEWSNIANKCRIAHGVDITRARQLLSELK